MKTILEWLNEAKEQGYEWADAAIRNYNPNFTTVKERENLREALAGAFPWASSPETIEFWRGVHSSIRYANAVNPTPLEFLIEDLGKLNNALENLEYNDTLKEPYRTQVYEATKASYEEQLAEIKTEIAKKLGIEPIKERKLIGWVVANAIDMVYLIGKPEKVKAGWSLTKSLTPEEAIALCGRVPKWDDEEPTPIYQ